jgi:hypothetical protein
MSLNRPPIVAGPIDRALKFLKRMSFNFGGVDSGTGEAVEGEVGVVSDDAAGEAVVAPGRAPIRAGDGVCAWRATMQPKLMKGIAIDLIDTISWINRIRSRSNFLCNPEQSCKSRLSPVSVVADRG